MRRTSARNRAFERIGSLYGPLIDPNHFLGRSSFDIKRKTKKEPEKQSNSDTQRLGINASKHKEEKFNMRLENNRA